MTTIRSWDASGMTTFEEKLNIPRSSYQSIKKLHTAVNECLEILEKKQSYSPFFLPFITVSYAMLCYCLMQSDINMPFHKPSRKLGDDALFVGGIFGTPTLFGLVGSIISPLIDPHKVRLRDHFPNKKIKKLISLALKLNIRISHDESIDNVITAFRMKKIELEKIIQYHQSCRIIFFQAFFDRKDSNTSTFRTLHQSEIFEKKIAKEIFKFM